MRKKYIATVGGLLAVLLFCSVVAAAWDDDNDDAYRLRQFIDEQVGGIDKLKVPAKDADIPLPRRPDGTVNPRYLTTEAKRYLGKLLFHDPIRSARININQGQPVDLPAGTAFGGTASASDSNVQAIAMATKQ